MINKCISSTGYGDDDDLYEYEPKSEIHSQNSIQGEISPSQKQALTADKIIEYMIYVILIVCGLYVTFVGFRAFRLTMMVNGFFFSYYIILFLVSDAGIYKGDNVGHQLGVFFGCLVLGFMISIICYVLDRANFFIFGCTVSIMICLYVAEFLVNLKDESTQISILFFGIFFICTLFFSSIAFFFLDHFIIFGCALIGGIVIPINFGILFFGLIPFENRSKGDAVEAKHFSYYLLATGLLFISGLGSQYYVRQNLIKKWTEEGDEENPRATFLVDQF